MFATRTEPYLPIHRCLPCLHSDDPRKQACALRHMAEQQDAPLEANAKSAPEGPQV